ncbi:WD repeat-containing protein 86 isoform X2 [Cervus canadensis]|uniref:WD repeat-containing protein 86 isoform X2 n=1 Tax=Cervus canadensis TaxID=1574408 RepID=UPI001C9E86EE|nr:WD repeat-containing protein 86 isoform X2 [Cervus canadensis]
MSLNFRQAGTRTRELRDLLPAGGRGRLYLQRRLHHQEVGCADRAVSAGVPGTHVHREQDPGRQQAALQWLLRQDGPRLERGQGAGGPGVPGSPQLCADPGLRRGALRGGGRGRGPPGDGQHGRHGQGVAGGQRLLPSDAAGPHGRRALPGAGRARPHGLHGQHGCHRPRLGHPERPAAARVPGAPGLRHLSGAGKPARVLGQRRQDGQVLAGRHRRARAHVHGPQTQRERPQVPRGHLTGQADPKPKGGGAVAALQSRLRPTRGASGPRLPTLTLRERTKDREVFTGSGDARARAFDAQSGALRRVFRGHAFVINCIQVGAPPSPGAAAGWQWLVERPRKGRAEGPRPPPPGQPRAPAGRASLGRGRPGLSRPLASAGAGPRPGDPGAAGRSRVGRRGAPRCRPPTPRARRCTARCSTPPRTTARCASGTFAASRRRAPPPPSAASRASSATRWAAPPPPRRCSRPETPRRRPRHRPARSAALPPVPGAPTGAAGAASPSRRRPSEALAEPPAPPSVPPGTLPRLSGSPAARVPGARGPGKPSLFLLSETDASKKARTGIFPWRSLVSDWALSR